MSKSPYNSSYAPPIPSQMVRLCLPGKTKTLGNFPAVVDTGADTTLVPIKYLRQLGAPIWNEAYLHSQWGERRHIYTYLLDVQIADYSLPGVVVVGDDQGQEIILGRNLLNKLILLLNGPQATLYILSKLPHHL